MMVFVALALVGETVIDLVEDGLIMVVDSIRESAAEDFVAAVEDVAVEDTEEESVEEEDVEEEVDIGVVEEVLDEDVAIDKYTMLEDEGIAVDSSTAIIDDNELIPTSPTALALEEVVAWFAVPFQTTGHEVTSTFKLAGTQLHIRKTLPSRNGRLLFVVCAASTILDRNEEVLALMVKALIWKDNWMRK